MPTSASGETSDRQALRLRASVGWILASVLAGWAFVYLPWLGRLDLQFEEPRRALVTQAMLQSGEYWVPQLAGEPYTAKPPLFNWVLAASATLYGQLDEWSARLPSVLCVLLLAVLFVWGARRSLGSWALGFLGASIVLSPEIIAKGHLAEIESLFALLVAASAGSWFLLYRARASGIKLWVLPLVLVALAYLTKREPAVAFFYLAVGPFLLLRGRWRVLLQAGHFVGIAAAALIVSGWLVATAAQTGWSALWQSLQSEVLERGLAGQGWRDIATHVVVYPLALFGAMLPFSALLPLLASAWVRLRVRARFEELFVFCVVAVVANLPIYWFRGDVAVRYFLPMFPFALLVAAMVFDVLLDELGNATAAVRRYVRAAQWGALAAGAVLVVLLLVSTALPRLVEGHVALMPAALVIVIAAAGGAALWILWRSSTTSPLPMLMLLFCATVLLGRTLFYNVVLADRVRRYADDRNAPAIAAGLLDKLGRDTVVLAREVPLAVWYYSDAVSLQPLRDDAPPAPGSWILIDERFRDEVAPLGFPAQEEARFVYRGDALLLGRLPRATGADAHDGSSTERVDGAAR